MCRAPFLDEPDYAPFDPATECPELVALTDPAGSDSYTPIAAGGSLACVVKADRVQPARRRLLGYEWADDAAPWALHRVRPAQHPLVEDLFVTQVDPLRMGPCGLPNPGAFAAAPGIEGGAANVVPMFPGKVAAGGDFHWTTRYLMAQLSIQFGQYPYAHRADGTVSGEYQRNVNYYEGYSSETTVLSAQTERLLTFCEGVPGSLVSPPPAGSPPGTPGTPNPAKAPSEILIYICKSSISIKWFRVPEEFIINPLNGIREKIDRCQSHVNEFEFLGWKPGTLMFLGARRDEYARGWTWPSGEPAKGFNVTFDFSYFDPVPGVTLEPVPPGGTAPTPKMYGHNLQPYYPSETGSIWYAAGKNGNSDPKSRHIPSAKFATMFEHVLKPATP